MADDIKPTEQPAPAPEKTPEQMAAEKLAADQKAAADKRAAEQKALAEKKAAERAAQIAKEKAEREAQIAALNKLKESVGKTFSDGTRTATIIGFEPQKGLGAAWKPAYLVNFGNPNAHHYIHCDEFLSTFKPSE